MRKYKRIYIEITNACNMTCSFCPKSTRETEFMSLELFEKILIDIKDFTNYIYLHIKGEPFFHPKFEEIIKITEKYDFKVNITTNGTLINNVKKYLSKNNSIRQVNFSLHSFEENKNTKQRKYLEDIVSFVRLEDKIIFSLRLWNLSETKNKSNDFTLSYLAKEFGIDKIEEKFSRGRGVKLAKNVYLNFEEVFEWPSLDMPLNSLGGRCEGLKSHVGILVDGTVVPCCLDGEGIISLGNIKEKSFKSIIEGERSRNMTNAFKNRKIIEELCSKCTFRNRFN